MVNEHEEDCSPVHRDYTSKPRCIGNRGTVCIRFVLVSCV